MAKEPKERVQVEGNLAAIARTRKIEPVDPTDPALSFMPPLASVDELTPTDITKTEAPQSPTDPETPKPVKEDVSARPPVDPRPSAPRSQKKSTPAPTHVNKAESGDYTRVTLRLHNDVITRLVALGLSQKKRYTTLIEDYIMAGLDRHKG